MSTTSSTPKSETHHQKPKPSPLKAFLKEPIREDLLLETQLLLLSFLTGIQDASTWPDYTCFASNQTGNALFLAIGLTSPPQPQPQNSTQSSSYSFPNITTSLALFIAGAFILGQTGNALGVRTRGFLLLSNFIQTLLIFAAVAIQQAYPITRDGLAARIVIGCLAFSSGGQVAMARSLGMTEITTAMATAVFVDVFSDPGLIRRKNRGRNRRLGFLVMLVCGCFVGAGLRRGVGRGVPLVVCAVGKGVVCGGFLGNRGMDVDDGNEMGEKEVKV
jgi:uncharacterized membrane protein YoaK (UPF0700 family)